MRFYMTHEITKLANGLTVITEMMPGIPSVSINIGVNNGSRYEPEGLNGISHFLEHMAFKGTSRRNARQIAEEFDAIGGYLNASTDREHTLYHAKLLKDDLPLAVDILADILQHSTFDAEELERECMVILQEIAQSNDTPDDIVFDYFMNTAFPNHPLGRNILGAEDIITNFNAATLRGYMAQYYSASNMVVAAVGNVTHQNFVEMVANAFTALPAPIKVHKEPFRYVGGVNAVVRDLEQVNIVLGLPAYSYHDDNYYAVQMLSTIFGGGMSSRLFQEVREKRGLAYTIQSFVSSYDDGGILGIFAGTAQEQVNELLLVLGDELLKLTDTISEAEFHRARAQLKAGQLMSQESSSYRAEELVRNMLAYGRHIPVEEVVTKIDGVTLNHVSALAGQLMQAPRFTLAAIGQVEGIVDVEAIAARLS
jgi:predicted Zn-dependent peptidase